MLRPGGRLAALALLAACGGTSGSEAIMGSDAASVTGVDASSGLDAPSAFDATAGIDANTGADTSQEIGASTADGDGLDRTIPVRPPPQDTGVPLGAADSGAPAPKDAGVTTYNDAAPPTMLSILAAQSPGASYDASDDTAIPKGCVGCAIGNGCLDPTMAGGNCDLLEGGLQHFSGSLPDGKNCSSSIGTEPVSEKRICLQTLAAIFATKCLDDHHVLTPCLCGATDPNTCQAGTEIPTGPLFDLYACDFNSTSGSVIATNFTLQQFGAGNANSIVQCLAANVSALAPGSTSPNGDPNCCTCFGLTGLDGGGCGP